MVLVDLHSKAASGDLAQLQRHWWLNKHRINGCDRDNQTPLHLACINGHADVVQFLIEKKCKLDAGDKNNKTPLMKAVEHQHRDCAALLLEHGASHDHKSANGNTALHLAAMVSSKSLAELLLEHGADIDAKNELGYTPLILSIIEHRDEMVEFLIQKGADMNVRDNVCRTPLAAAALSGNKKAAQILIQHGAVLPQSDRESYTGRTLTKLLQNSAVAKEKIDSSYCETTPVTLFKAPSLEESCDVPKEGAGEEEDNGPEADQNKMSVQCITVQPYRGGYKPAGIEKKEDKHSLCNPETDSNNQGKVSAGVQLPANGKRLDAHSAAVECSKDVLPGQMENEHDNSSSGSELVSEDLHKVAATVLLPADVRKMLHQPSVATVHGKGALPAAEAAKKAVSGSPYDPKTASKSQGSVLAGVKLPAVNFKSMDVPSAAVECGKGGSENEPDNSPSAEMNSKGQGKVSAGVQLPAANCNRLNASSAAVECGKGVLKPAGGKANTEDFDFLWDSETGSESEGKVSASVQHCIRMDARSAAAECSKGDSEKEEDASTWSSEPLSDLLDRMITGVRHRVAKRNRVGVRSAAAERSKGDDKAAGAEKKGEKHSLCNAKTNSKSERQLLPSVHLSAPKCNRLDMRSASAERGKGDYKEAGAENKGDKHSLCNPKTDSKSERQLLPGVKLPAAICKKLDVRSAAAERGKGGPENENDNSPNAESFSKVLEEERTGMRRPAADCKGKGVCSAPAERSKGVSQPAQGAEDDDSSPWDSETNSKSERQLLPSVHLSAPKCNRLDMRSASAERGKGDYKEAGAENKGDKHSLCNPKTDSKSERQLLPGVKLPAAICKKLDVRSAAAERGKATREEQKKHFTPSSKNKLSALYREHLKEKTDSSTQTAQPKVDCTTQTSSEQEKQPLARQKLDKSVQKDSLEEASLGAVKSNSREKRKLLLEKLQRSRSMLKDMKERLHQNNYYMEAVKNAKEEPEKRRTIVTNLQQHLVDVAGAAAVPQLEECIKQLQIKKAWLEATAQQQTKTVEVLEKLVQTRATLRTLHRKDRQPEVDSST